MKIENLHNHSIKNVIIKPDDRGIYSFGFSHLVTIYKLDREVVVNRKNYYFFLSYGGRWCDFYLQILV